MLIRSQDKKSILNLDNVMQISVVIPLCCDNEYAVIGNGAVMGTYSTEEKAIKVLDDIFQAYKNLQFVDGITFKMPQDNEVYPCKPYAIF